MNDRYFAKVLEAVLVIILVASPLALGSVHPWAYKAVSSAVYVLVFLRAAVALSKGGLSYLPSPLLYFIPLSAALALVQVTPLPAVLVEAISPGRASLRQAAGLAGGFDTLAVYPWAAFGGSAFFVSVLLLFFLVVNNISSGPAIRRIRYAALGTGVLVAVMLFVQKATVAGRSTLPFVNKNHFAGYMEVLIPVAAAQLAFVSTARAGRGTRGGSVASHILDGRTAASALALSAAVLLMSSSVILSLSRAGMAGMVLSFVVLGAVVVRYEKRALGFLGISLLALVFAFVLMPRDDLARRMKAIVDFSEGSSMAVRLNVWRDTANMASEFPAVGAGAGGFETAYPLYKTIRREYHVFQPESDYLFVLAEAGLAGLLLAFGFVYIYARALAESLRRRKDYLAAGLSAGVLAALSAVLLHGLVDTSLHMPAILLVLVILMGAAYSASLRVFEPGGAGRPRRQGRLVIKGRPYAAAAVALCAAGALAMSVLMGVGAAADFHYATAVRDRDEMLGSATASPGDYIGVASGFEAASRLEPFSSEYSFEKGRSFFLIAGYTAALEAMGGDTGGFLRPDEYYGKALSAFDNAVENNPYSSFAHLMDGRALEHGPGLAEQAEAEYLKAERLNPTSPFIKRFLSAYFRRKGEIGLANSYAAELPYLDPKYNTVEIRSIEPESPDYISQEGEAVVWNADAVSPAGGLEYRFRIWKLGEGWVSGRPFSPDASWTWDTSGLGPGSYVAFVWVRRSADRGGSVKLASDRRFVLTGRQ